MGSISILLNISHLVQAVCYAACPTVVPRSSFVPDQGVCLGWMNLWGLDRVTGWPSAALGTLQGGQGGGGSSSPTPTGPLKSPLLLHFSMASHVLSWFCPFFGFAMVFSVISVPCNEEWVCVAVLLTVCACVTLPQVHFISWKKVQFMQFL